MSGLFSWSGIIDLGVLLGLALFLILILERERHDRWRPLARADLEERIDRVLLRRKMADYEQASRGAIVTSAVVFIGALFSIFGSVTPSIIFAVAAVLYAAVIVLRYAIARQDAVQRVATLRVRDPGSALPWPAYALVLLVSMAPLLFLETARASALIIMTIALTLVGFAWALVVLPMRVSGDDPATERAIDEWLRNVKAFDILALAAGLIFVFTATEGFKSSALQGLAYFGSCATFCGLLQLAYRERRRPPSFR